MKYDVLLFVAIAFALAVRSRIGTCSLYVENEISKSQENAQRSHATHTGIESAMVRWPGQLQTPRGTHQNGRVRWKYAAAQLEAFGATAVPTDASERTEWLNTSLQSLATRVRHKGNHKYACPLNAAIRRQLPASLPYPKSLDPIYTAL